MQKTLAEFLGTSILALAVVGSGAMAQILSDDVGLQLLINASATATDIEQFAGWPNERLTLKIFVMTWAFTYE